MNLQNDYLIQNATFNQVADKPRGKIQI